MRLPICVLLTAALGTIGQCACIWPLRPAPLTPNESEALETVQRQLVVLPVFTGSAASGFPISSRNVISAAHAFGECSALASVQGLPMFVMLPDQKGLKSRPPERDWIDLHATTDQFSPNVIDGTVVLRRGDLVFLGGYRPTKPPHPQIHDSHRPPQGTAHGFDSSTSSRKRRFDASDPLELCRYWYVTRRNALLRWSLTRRRSRSEILAGRVVTPERSDGGPCLVDVEVPAMDYGGFSGGPAAILDDMGHVRVWGVIVRQGWIVDRSPPWRLRFVIKLARLPQEAMDTIQHGKFWNASEVPKTTPAPASRPTSSATEPDDRHAAASDLQHRAAGFSPRGAAREMGASTEASVRVPE